MAGELAAAVLLCGQELGWRSWREQPELDTHEQALEGARPGHDEFFRFLAPYGRSRSYLDENGKPWEWGRMPTLEDSIAQGAWIVGTAENRDGDLRAFLLLPNGAAKPLRK